MGGVEEKMFYLENIRIFRDLTEADLKMFDRITYMTTAYGHSERINGQDNPGSVVCFLKQGRVKMYKRSLEGEEHTLGILEVGDIFGVMQPVNDSAGDTIAETLDESLVCIIRRRDFELFLRKKTELAMRVTKRIGMRRRRIENPLERLLFRTVSSRLALFLLSLAGTHGAHDSRGIVLSVKLSEQELSNLIGSARETTSALLKELGRLNIIEIRSGRIMFLNQWRLKKLADAKTHELEIPSLEESDMNGLGPPGVI